MFGSLCAIVGAVFIAISLMQMRKLGKKVHFLVPPLYQALTNCIVAPIPMIIMIFTQKFGSTRYGWYEALMLFLISVAGFMA